MGQLAVAVESQSKIAENARDNLRIAEKKLFEADMALNYCVNELGDAEVAIQLQTQLDAARLIIYKLCSASSTIVMNVI